MIGGVLQHARSPVLRQRLYFTAMNGSFARRTDRRSPRNSAKIDTSAWVGAVVTEPIAIGVVMVGPNPPGVTMHIASTDCASRNKRVPWRIGARPSGRRPTRLRDAPF